MKDSAIVGHDKDLEALRLLLWQNDDDTMPPPESRFMAIICTAYIEKYLGEYLKRHLPGANSDLIEKLFKSQGLLGPLGAKIEIAQAMKLIDADWAADLRRIAAIRNLFAHNLDIADFKHKDIITEFDKITLVALYPNATKHKSRNRKFRWLAYFICRHLRNVINDVNARLSHHSIKDE